MESVIQQCNRSEQSGNFNRERGVVTRIEREPMHMGSLYKYGLPVLTRAGRKRDHLVL